MADHFEWRDKTNLGAGTRGGSIVFRICFFRGMFCFVAAYCHRVAEDNGG